MKNTIRLTYPTALVIAGIQRGHRHGFDIIDACGLSAGTVYPILRRLEDAGLLAGAWERPALARAEGRPPRRNYRLTQAGQAAAREALERYPGVAAVFAAARPAEA